MDFLDFADLLDSEIFSIPSNSAKNPAIISAGRGPSKSFGTLINPLNIPRGRVGFVFLFPVLRVMNFSGTMQERRDSNQKTLRALHVYFGGADGVRTRDLIDAIDARSQLRYGPTRETE
jgi:hypothetical protein